MNPPDKSCWKLCTACLRCANKGIHSKCSSCSGRVDPLGKRDPYDIDDFCLCTQGILRYRLQNGRLIIAKYPGDPFGGKIQTDRETQDESDWNSWVHDKREQLDNEHWDPVQFYDGTSTHDWTRRARG